jgi:hypothetical protein
MAEDLQLLVQLPVVHQPPGVVGPLVVRLPERQVPGAADPGRAPDVAAHRQPVDAPGAGGRPGQEQGAGRGPLGGPDGFVPPAAGMLAEVGGGPGGLADEHGHRRGLVDAVGFAPQPPVPPADHLGDQVDPRPGQGAVGGRVTPGPEQQPGRRPQPLQHPEGGVAVAVGPAGHQHRRAGDPLIGRPQRPLAPVRPVVLLLQPPQQPRLEALDPRPPPFPPLRPGDRQDRRQGVQGDHVERVVDQVEQLRDPPVSWTSSV